MRTKFVSSGIACVIPWRQFFDAGDTGNATTVAYWTERARMTYPGARVEVRPSGRAKPFVFGTTVLETFMGRRFDDRTRLEEFVASFGEGC